MPFRFFTIFLLSLFTMSGAAFAAGPSNITVVNNAALQAGQSLTIAEYKITAGKERLAKKQVLGPVAADCVNGCGSTPVGFGAGPGTYRLEVSGGPSSEKSFVTFTFQLGEEYIWMITNRTSPPSYQTTAPGIGEVSHKGPFRIDLVTYTQAQKPPVTAAAPRKAETHSFWPFKPVNRQRQPPNN